MASTTSAQSTSEKRPLTLVFSDVTETRLEYVLFQFEEPRRGSPSVEGVARPYRIPQLLQVEPPHHHITHPHHGGHYHPSHPHHGGQDHLHSLDDTDHEGQDPTHDAVCDDSDVDTGSVVTGPTTF